LSLALVHAIKEHLAAQLEPEEYQVWIAPLTSLAAEADRLVLGCPNAFHLAWIRDHHLAGLGKALKEMGSSRRIALDVDPAAQVRPPAQPAPPKQLRLPQLTVEHPGFNRRFIFDRFVAGSGNEFACAAAKAMAQGKSLFTNTLFLVSSTGLGKSHLTQAVGNQVLGLGSPSRVSYLTAEDFANQMIAALRNRRMEEFKDRFRRGCDLLLLEEVQFLAGKDKTQEELGYTLDTIWDQGGRVVFTGNCLPQQIKGIKQHLMSRLAAGVTAAIEPPDHLTRVRILQGMAQEEGLAVPQEVMEYLAEEITGDVRRLQSALVGLAAKGSLVGRPLDLRLAAEILGQMHLQLRRVSTEQIRDLVARLYGLEPQVLTGKTRRKAVTRPRNLALYLCRRHTEASYAAIGRTFNRDHSTVMYGVEQVERGLTSDPKLAQELAFIEQRLGLG
jgi:chromosomal replication initiator protein